LDQFLLYVGFGIVTGEVGDLADGVLQRQRHRRQRQQAMKKVTNPPGTACFAYAECKKLLTAGTKINYEGASGSLDYNQYNNVFGPYGAFKVDLKGNEQQVGLLSAAALAKATP
jgi:hypothetical protein